MKNKPVLKNLEECIAGAKSGDVKAFEAIVSHYQSYVYAIAARFLCNETDAEEIVQESYVRLWKSIAKFDEGCKFTTWLYKIVVNLCLDKTKSEKRRNKLFVKMNPESSEILQKSNDSLEEEYTDKEMIELIKTIADGLSNKQRMIFLLRDIEDLSVREVSEITRMSESSVKTNLCFARRTIRERIMKMENFNDL
jgi:RNA polymerase sigma-70 factor (ECF subfamily)